MSFQKAKNWFCLWGAILGWALGFFPTGPGEAQTSYSLRDPIVIPRLFRFNDPGIGRMKISNTLSDGQQSVSAFEALEENPLIKTVKTAGFEMISFPGAPSGGSEVVWEGVVLNDPSTVGNSFDFSFLTGDSFQEIELEQGTNPLLSSSALGGLILLKTPQSLFTPGVDGEGFLGQIQGDSHNGKSLQLSQFIPFSKGKLYLAGHYLNLKDAFKGESPLRKHQNQIGKSLSLMGQYGSPQRTQMVFLCRTAQDRSDDMYDDQGTLEGDAYYFIGRIKHLSQEGRTRTHVNFSDILYDRRAFHQSLNLATYRGERQGVQYENIHILKEGIQIQGGFEVLRERAKDSGFSAIRDTVSLFLGPTVPLTNHIVGQGSFRVNQGPHDRLMASMVGLEYDHAGETLSIKFDRAQKRPSLYQLYAQRRNVSGSPSEVSFYPVGNASLKEEQSWGGTTRLTKTFFQGLLMGGWDLFYRKFENYIYVPSTLPAAYSQGGRASTWGFGPTIQVKSGVWKLMSQVQWFRLSHSRQIPSFALSPGQAQAKSQISYDSGGTQGGSFGGYVSVVTRYKPYSTLGQSKTYSMVVMGISYRIQKNTLWYLRCQNVLNKRIQDPYEPHLQVDPWSLRLGIKMDL